MTEEQSERDAYELVQWVKLAQDGDSGAFESIFQRTQGLARKIACSILDQHAVDDAVQESYILVYRKLPQLREPAAFIAWLSRLVLFTSYRLAKRTKPEQQISGEIPVEKSKTDELLDAIAIRQALGRMPQRDRDVLILREFLTLSYEEVAYALKIPVGTVRSRLNSARKKLGDNLKM